MRLKAVYTDAYFRKFSLNSRQISIHQVCFDKSAKSLSDVYLSWLDTNALRRDLTLEGPGSVVSREMSDMGSSRDKDVSLAVVKNMHV